jgi:hypothetical protein
MFCQTITAPRNKGNSLVYDGVGAVFWLLVGQLYQTAAPARPSRPMQSAMAVTAPA